jgi:C-terminal processing protease CtpA/Prc
MKKLTRPLFLAALLCASLGLVAAPDHPDLLDFELGATEGHPTGWLGGPTETLHADSLIVHGGRWSARIERDGESEGEFTALSTVIDQEKQGQFITLRGYLRTENVEGMAGLWLRLDGDSGIVGFDNMHRRKLSGTNDWAEYTIALPYDQATRQVVFGALLSGTGKVWVDDLQLLVDGKPFALAPDRERELTVLDLDTEFDDGSGISATEYTAAQLQNLVLLGKVWGFLKYHHPAVTGGRHHWDFELFRVLPRVLEAADRKEAVGVLLTWIDRLGEIAPCNPCAELPEDLSGRPRLAWLDDEDLLGRALGRRLWEIHAARPADGKQFYLTQMPNVGNPIFQNEKSYTETGVPDPGYRLLAVFRYWNIIEYWFPNRDIIDRDWDEVLAVYLPVAAAADDVESYQLAMLQLIAEVRDGHANLYSADEFRPPVGECRLPVVVRHVEGKAVVTAYADSSIGAASGLLPGDVILKIDGADVTQLMQQWQPYYPASNQPFREAAMARNLTRGPWGEVALEIERDGEISTLKANRVKISRADLMAGRKHDLPGETFQLLGEEVGYLKLSSVELPQIAGYLEKAAGTRGLVVDIRNYPSSFVVFALGGRLVDEITPFVCFTRGDLANPGAFIWRPAISLTPMNPSYPGKVAILVDESSMSQAEYTAMALRAGPRAMVIGSTTAGADGNISGITLPGGLRTNISGIGVFYPDRAPTQRVGIVPDVEVRPTIAGLRQGRDEVLEEAILQILGREISNREIRALYP